MFYDECNEATNAFMFTGPFRDCCPPTDATIFTLDPPGTFPPLADVPNLTGGGPFVEPFVPVGTAGDFPPGRFIPADPLPPVISAIPLDPMAPGFSPEQPPLVSLPADPMSSGNRPQMKFKAQRARFGQEEETHSTLTQAAVGVVIGYVVGRYVL